MISFRKQIVEDTPSITASEAKGIKNDQAVLRWKHLGLISAWKGFGDYFLVNVEGARRQQRIGIVYTRTGFGERPWLVCPGCAEKRNRLYLANKIFACRECHNLTYLSCRASGNELRRLNWKVRDLQYRLGMDTLVNDVFSPDYVGIEDTPIFKPKYMKQETWERLRRELEIAQLRRLEAWINRAKSIGKRYF